MADLIDRAALLEKLELLAKHEDPFRETVIRGVMFTISNETAVDAVEVVRCKDCKKSGMYAFGHDVTERLACLDIDDFGCVYMATSVEPMDFCGYGERKET